MVKANGHIQMDQFILGCLKIGNFTDLDFLKSYKISGIPRFILIDPKGNIIDPDAPRPSSSELTKLLEELGV